MINNFLHIFSVIWERNHQTAKEAQKQRKERTI